MYISRPGKKNRQWPEHKLITSLTAKKDVHRYMSILHVNIYRGVCVSTPVSKVFKFLFCRGAKTLDEFCANEDTHHWL